MSNRIANFRRLRRMSLDDLSEASGLSKSTLSELERGMTRPMLDSARRIAHALDAYEHEVWPEDSTMPLTTCAVDTELTAAKARIAELEDYVGKFAIQDKRFPAIHYSDDASPIAIRIDVGDLRRAAALLNKEPTND